MAIKSSSIMLMVLALVALMATSSKAQAQLCPVTVGVVRGFLNCSVNSSIPAPPFPNANLSLKCAGVTVASTVTSNSGAFSIVLNLLQLLAFLRNLLFGGCTVVVTTPLAACNATLPSTGTLVAPVVFTLIDLLGSILAYFFGVLEFIFTP